MSIETGIDYQRFWDGSQRWLWRVIYRDNLWIAGVETSLIAAKASAKYAWEALLARLPQRERDVMPGAQDAPICDLDAIERGEGDGGTLVV